MQIHVNGPEAGTKNFDNLMTAAVPAWQSKPRVNLLKARMIAKETNQDESSHAGQVTEIVTLRDAEIQVKWSEVKWSLYLSRVAQNSI